MNLSTIFTKLNYPIIQFMHSATCRQHVFFVLTAFLSILFICIGVISGQWQIFSLPFMVISSLLFILLPSIIPFVFIASFFAGISLFQKDLLSIAVPHAALCLLIIAITPSLSKQIKLRVTSSISFKTCYIILCLYFLWAGVSLLINISSHHSMEIYTAFWQYFNFLLLIVCFLLFSLPIFTQHREQIFSYLITFATLESLFAVIQKYVLYSDVIGGTYSHHSMLGNVIVIATGLCIYRILDIKRNTSRKVIYLACISFNMFGLIISGSRSIIVGMLAAVAISLVVKYHISLRLIIWLSISAILLWLLAIYSPLRLVIDHTFKSNQTPLAVDMSTFTRFIIWTESLKVFLNEPIWQKLTGVGIGMFPTINFSVFLEGSNHATGGHNNFIHALMETGIIGLLCFISFFGYVLFSLARKISTDNCAFGFFFITIALLASSFSQETFWFNAAFPCFWILYTSVLSLVMHSDSITITRPSADMSMSDSEIQTKQMGKG